MKPRLGAFLLFGTVTLAMTGCTHSLMETSWPLPPEDIAKMPSPDLAPPAKNLNYGMLKRAIVHTEKLISYINNETDKRGRMDWASGDHTSVGAIAAVAGAIADQTGLMNTGAGISLLGMTARERYQYNLQFTTYAGAKQALDCVLEHVKTVNDDDVYWGIIQKESAETTEAASNLAGNVVAATRKVKERLETRLRAIESTPINAADFKTVLDAERKAKDDMDAAERDLDNKVNNDRRELARINALGRNFSSDDTAKKARIKDETDLVPLSLQTEKGVRLVALPAKITTCVAGY